MNESVPSSRTARYRTEGSVQGLLVKVVMRYQVFRLHSCAERGKCAPADDARGLARSGATGPN